VTMNVTEHITQVEIDAGRKKQLERYEPISEHTTITADVPDGLSEEELDEFVEALSVKARERCEQGITRRFEEHVREEAFGDD